MSILLHQHRLHPSRTPFPNGLGGHVWTAFPSMLHSPFVCTWGWSGALCSFSQCEVFLALSALFGSSFRVADFLLSLFDSDYGYCIWSHGVPVLWTFCLSDLDLSVRTFKTKWTALTSAPLPPDFTHCLSTYLRKVPGSPSRVSQLRVRVFRAPHSDDPRDLFFFSPASFICIN